MPEVIVILLELLVWFGLPLALDVILANGAGILRESVVAYGDSFDRNNPDALQANVGFLLLGGVMGLAVSAVFPERVIPEVISPVVGLLLAPVATGFAMRVWGQSRRKRDLKTSRLATFVGGASMGLGFTLMRYHFLQ